jgi:hypothetical protein
MSLRVHGRRGSTPRCRPQGRHCVSPEHVQAYFDEWVFRFNRRHSRSRGLLFHTRLRQAVEGQPVTYRSLRKTGRTRPAPQPARGARQLPPSLDVGRPELPWRT